MSNKANQTVGGQAVLEGVMMRTPHGWAVACRTPDNDIVAEAHELPRLSSRSRAARIPLIRGVMVLVESLTLGTRALTWSAQQQTEEDEEDLTGWQLGMSLAFAFAIAIGLFVIVPTFLGRWIAGDNTILFVVVEGIIRVVFFVAYIWALGRSEELGRVFRYHGAEHKTIHAYESGDPLSIEAVQQYPPEHPRCGTSFLIIVMLLSIVVFGFVGQPGIVIEIVLRIVLIPVIAGISYEVLRFSGLGGHGTIDRILAAPGLLLQKLTTGQPSDDMVEVAITSLLSALDDNKRIEVQGRGAIPEASLAAVVSADG